MADNTDEPTLEKSFVSYTITIENCIERGSEYLYQLDPPLTMVSSYQVASAVLRPVGVLAGVHINEPSLSSASSRPGKKQANSNPLTIATTILNPTLNAYVTLNNIAHRICIPLLGSLNFSFIDFSNDPVPGITDFVITINFEYYREVDQSLKPSIANW